MSVATPSSILWSQITDSDLTLALQRNDAAAQRELWRRFAPVVRRIAWRRLRYVGDLDDAVQDVFVRVFRNVGALRDPAALRAFVLSVATRTLTRVRRGRRRRFRTTLEFQSIVELDEQSHYSVWPESRAASKSAYNHLERLLSRLQSRDRHAYLLHFVDGLKSTEVAQVLGVSVPTAKRSFGYAKKRIDGWALQEPALAEYAQAAQRALARVA